MPCRGVVGEVFVSSFVSEVVGEVGGGVHVELKTSNSKASFDKSALIMSAISICFMRGKSVQITRFVDRDSPVARSF